MRIITFHLHVDASMLICLNDPLLGPTDKTAATLRYRIGVAAKEVTSKARIQKNIQPMVDGDKDISLIGKRSNKLGRRRFRRATND